MTPLKTARMMRGLTQTALADALNVSAPTLCAYERGDRNLGAKLLPAAAAALGVSAAYLRGDAQRLAVRDFVTGEVYALPIISESVIDSYGVYYLVEVEEIGVIAVILADGVQFTPADWQGEQPMDTDEIADCRWVDAYGRDAIMMDGLPRVLAD